MKERRQITLLIVCAAVAPALLISTRLISAQKRESERKEPPPPVYNPYPPGILPADLPQEIERVRREGRFLENEAIAEWQALTPLTLVGQPPIFQGTGYRDLQVTCNQLYYEQHISPVS